LKASKTGLLKAAEKNFRQKPGLVRRASAAEAGLRRIIGVDPGLASTGWGVLEYSGSRLRYIAHGCIETPAAQPRGERLFFIYQSFVKILETYKPAESAIENLYFGKNISSAMAVAEARGVLSMALARYKLPILELTPNAIKKAVVGEISADKAQIQEMVRFLLGLKETPRPDHAADALGAAICCAHSGSLL
jgi:crossover junction endodeoxyribonuclease RuvC